METCRGSVTNYMERGASVAQWLASPPRDLQGPFCRRLEPLSQVRCGSVYITPSDSTTKVVQAVLATPSVKEKKRRAAKYTVAVGTCHGHVQAFLKDSDVVLSAFDQCPAEEKCLMLIKRPKESSKKLSKAQSAQNLSMSDTQLYRQFDGTAFNSPYTAHKMKGKANSARNDNSQLTSEVYRTEPRVRRAAGPAAISAAHKKWPAARPNNTFVPIPELGIYTPEQHVLQNGTYAQHCHSREVNNNSSSRRSNAGVHNGGLAPTRNSGGSNQNFSYNASNGLHTRQSGNSNLDSNNTYNNNVNNNSSFNSSFDESVSSYGYAPAKGVLRGYDPAAAVGVPASGNSRYPSGDVYHSCVDISHTYREGRPGDDEFNTLSSRRSYDPPVYAPVREEAERVRLRLPEQSNGRRDERDSRADGYRNAEDTDENSKMEAAARSYSLGDLSAGLSFSLVGQKKSGSVTTVNGVGRGGRGLSSPGLAPKSVRPAPSAASIISSDREEGSSALKHIRERLQKAVFKSQDKRNNSSNNPSQKQPPRAPVQSREPGNHHYQRRGDTNYKKQSWQQQQQQQRQRQEQPHIDEQRTYPGSYQRQMSAPEGAQSMSSPRNRRDSEDTVSSYRSAQSDTSVHHSAQNLPFSSSGFHTVGRVNKISNNISNSSNSISSTLNNTDSSGNSFATANSTSTITNTAEASKTHNGAHHSSSRDKSSASPSKPKRSLPNVPLSETSERIKRFTEMMKSRMSTGSRTGSSNGSRSGSSTKHTPTQRSTDSACSHTSLSRKSSMETASDSEVFTINGGESHISNRDAGNTKHLQHQQHQLNNVQHKPYQDSLDKRGNNPAALTSGNSVGVRNEDQYASRGYNGQSQSHHSHRPLTSEDTPLPPGDRSTDSGQTTGTNQSYNGSAMDSGYTTNNDADNDSFNTNNHNQIQHNNFHNIDSHHQHSQHQDPTRHYPQRPPNHGHPQNHHTSSLSHPHSGNHQQYSFSSRSHNPQSDHEYGSADLPLPAFSDRKSRDFYDPQIKRNSNLTNAHRFGSVQNVSSAQAHGTPRDTDLLPVNESTPNGYRQQQFPHVQRYESGPFSAREYSNKQNSKNQSQSGQTQDHRQSYGGRRSWDFADARLDHEVPSNPTFHESNLKKYDRGAVRYKSTEVISSSKPLFTDANYVNTDHIHPNSYVNKQNGIVMNTNGGKTAQTLQEQSQALSARFRTMQLGNGGDHRNHNQMSLSYHSGMNKTSSTDHSNNSNRGVHSATNPDYAPSLPTSQVIVNNTSQAFRTNGNNNYQSHNHNQQQPQPQQLYHKSPRDAGQFESKGNFSQQNKQLSDRHQLHPANARQHPQQSDCGNNTSSHGEVVKLRPVPMSRANRNARGRTLPGGFRFSDAEIAAAGAGDNNSSTPYLLNSQQSSPPGRDQGHEVMLFHLTQKFDLCPLLINLPRHVSLKDLVEVSEFVVEISLVGVPGPGGSPLGGPSSPQGPIASKIGSPGSAFSPVRNSHDFEGSNGGSSGDPADNSEKMLSAKVKVIRFAHVWGEELQRHTTLGRLLEGDIVVEVNGWFCLGADITYLARVVESCQGAITFTVARPKESEEKRFKGQTPAERVRGLEAEISRLDEIIHVKDEKIRDMTSSGGSSAKQSLSAIAAINGEIPVEGMVIGDDEYVV
ncbi:hypothetical protein PoB_002634100 [Plakobranchus ocellatus]|uniref:PDZ domain-containing protein n=1 Tax=Plakobranchus ocellatus TaxID=259542 RepID=A0AAV3ZZ77_9GAST|nr:hypothetical protein PoB_002634100 [Plakobranchus ocellatus]